METKIIKDTFSKDIEILQTELDNLINEIEKGDFHQAYWHKSKMFNVAKTMSEKLIWLKLDTEIKKHGIL